MNKKIICNSCKKDITNKSKGKVKGLYYCTACYLTYCWNFIPEENENKKSTTNKRVSKTSS